MNKKEKRIHEAAVAKAKVYLTCEIELLEILLEVDRLRLFEHFECGYLKTYCMKELGLSEEVSKAYVRVVRKNSKVPMFVEAVLNGEVTLSKAKAIASAVTQENCQEWVAKARTETKKSLERQVSLASGRKTKTLTLEFTHECVEMIERTQDLLSSKEQRYATQEEAIEWALKNNLDKHDPLRRAKGRSPGTLSTELQVIVRDQDQCAWIYRDGTRCEERKWLHHHHIVFRSHGGDDSVDNLQTLCAAHHRLLHKQHEAH